MAAKRTDFPGISLDWDLQAERRSDVTQAQWEDGVLQTLREPNPVFELYAAQNRFLPGGRQIAPR